MGDPYGRGDTPRSPAGKDGATAIDRGHLTGPTSPWVSGRRPCGVRWQQLSREGMRVVALALVRRVCLLLVPMLVGGLCLLSWRVCGAIITRRG